MPSGLTVVAVGLLVAGLGLMVVGAEWLVRGASRLAEAARVSPLAIGLTVVAYGTSAPEFAVSVGSSLSGDSDIALGNVVGSNVCNVLLILGLAAVVAPLAVSSRLVRFDAPLVLAVSLLVALLAWDGALGRGDGMILLAVAIALTTFQLAMSRREQPETSVAVEGASSQSIATSAGLVAVGLAMLVAGSQWFVQGAVSVAQAWGVSHLVIGLTVVAVGTSMPELVTSVVASLRGERDIAVGNVIGSNLFNLTAVLGGAAAAAPDGVPIADAALRFDLPVMIGTAVLCLPIFFTDQRVDRKEGALLLGYYAAYVAYLVLKAGRHAAAPALGDALRWFVIPMTVLVLLTLSVRQWRGVSG